MYDAYIWTIRLDLPRGWPAAVCFGLDLKKKQRINGLRIPGTHRSALHRDLVYGDMVLSYWYPIWDLHVEGGLV